MVFENEQAKRLTESISLINVRENYWNKIK